MWLQSIVSPISTYQVLLSGGKREREGGMEGGPSLMSHIIGIIIILFLGFPW